MIKESESGYSVFVGGSRGIIRWKLRGGMRDGEQVQDWVDCIEVNEVGKEV